MMEGMIDDIRKKSTIQSSHTVSEFDVKHRVCRMGKIRSDLMDFKVIKGGQWLL
jgi:hypothetical protein